MNPRAEALMNKVNAQMARRYKSKAPSLKSGSELEPIEWISTGLLAHDWINGGGGPRGRLEQLIGAKSSGKTTIALRRIAEAQRMGLVAAFIDAEHALDKLWAQKLGVVLDDLILYEPEDYDSAEVTLDVVIELLDSDDPPDVLVVDSVPKLCPKAVIEGGMVDKHYAGVASVMSQFLKKIIGPGILANSGTNLIFINQPREVIGARFYMERYPGGKDLSHDSSITTIVREGDYIFSSNDKNADKIGKKISIINYKNRCRYPYRESTLSLYFSQGFNPLLDVLEFGDHYGMIDYKANGWAYYGEENIGQGRAQHAQWLYNHLDIYKEMRDKIRELILAGK